MLAFCCQMLPQPLLQRAGGRRRRKILDRGQGGRVPRCLVRGCSGSHLLTGLVLAVRRYQLLLAPTPALSQRKVPTYTWKYHGKPTDSAFPFCPFKLHGELMTTCGASKLSSCVIPKLNSQWPKQLKANRIPFSLFLLLSRRDLKEE